MVRLPPALVYQILHSFMHATVDAVVDLLQMAEGSADEALLSHAVEAMRKRYGKAVADRLQSELDDRVRASSSSGVKSIALKSDLSGLP